MTRADESPKIPRTSSSGRKPANRYASRRRLRLRIVAIAKSCQFLQGLQTLKTGFQQGFPANTWQFLPTLFHEDPIFICPHKIWVDFVDKYNFKACFLEPLTLTLALIYTVPMPTPIATAEYMKLSISERIQLVEDIWDSIAADAPNTVELSQAQKTELHRRVTAHRTDPSTVVPWEQVRSKLFPGKP